MDKKNFEKDINVPSKNIEYHNDAKDCELAKSSSCCWCKNMSCYQLEEQLEAYKMEAEEGKEINAELKAENETQKETIDEFLTILDKLGKSNIKLRETITEIKEIAEIRKDDINDWLAKEILQKISECEVMDE